MSYYISNWRNVSNYGTLFFIKSIVEVILNILLCFDNPDSFQSSTLQETHDRPENDFKGF